ncbi:hypothetical protein ROHU_008748 [Labeo rohita]|uniref:Uncharacterized protein n=1 Tax=Labeo rohita TaxID=84645 RepID=A0A498M7Q8_LABRO|nr:hypothetical protein ROHU_008748 [Labeo rohita]
MPPKMPDDSATQSGADNRPLVLRPARSRSPIQEKFLEKPRNENRRTALKGINSAVKRIANSAPCQRSPDPDKHGGGRGPFKSPRACK